MQAAGSDFDIFFPSWLTKPWRYTVGTEPLHHRVIRIILATQKGYHTLLHHLGWVEFFDNLGFALVTP